MKTLFCICFGLALTNPANAQYSNTDGAFEVGAQSKLYMNSGRILSGGSVKAWIADSPISIPVTILTDGRTSTASIGALLDVTDGEVFSANVGLALEYMYISNNPDYLQELSRTSSLMLATELQQKLGKRVSVSAKFEFDATNGTRASEGWSGSEDNGTYFKQWHARKFGGHPAGQEALNAWKAENSKVSKSGVALTLRVRLGK